MDKYRKMYEATTVARNAASEALDEAKREYEEEKSC